MVSTANGKLGRAQTVYEAPRSEAEGLTCGKATRSPQRPQEGQGQSVCRMPFIKAKMPFETPPDSEGVQILQWPRRA